MIEDFAPFEANFETQLPADDLLVPDFSSGPEPEDDRFEPVPSPSQFPADVPSARNLPLDELQEPSAKPQEVGDEPETIKNWREQMKKQLEQKDAEEEIKKEELRQTAQKELADWYTRYRESVAKCKANNRSMAADWLAVREPGARMPEWDTIARLCDFSPKTTRNVKDVSRMRSIILQLKQTPPVPSVSLTSI